MKKYNVHNKLSFYVKNTSHILEVREQLASLLKKGGFSSSKQTLIVSTVSEISRCFLKQIPALDILVSEISNNGKRGISVTFRIHHSEKDMFQSEDDAAYSDQTIFSQVVEGELNRLCTIFDETMPDTTAGSDSSLTVTKWISDDLHIWGK